MERSFPKRNYQFELVKVFKAVKLGGILLVIISLSFSTERERIRYTREPTIPIPENESELRSIDIFNSISMDSLTLVEAVKSSIPLYYSRHLVTEVCYDEECRLLDIYVYWNITGRYLLKNSPKASS